MKKMLIIPTVSLLLAGCGMFGQTNPELEAPKESVKHVQKAPKQLTPKKIVLKKNQKVVKNGVTYIDGVLIVNKKIGLPKSYNPGENKTARKALNQLMNYGHRNGLNFVIRSGYRDYNYQAQLYQNYAARDGYAMADTYSARAGHSEHQTGLAFDIGSYDSVNDFNISFGNTREGKWLQKNAHRYGFIIRYMKGKEHITGYQYEPWHIRYVGKSLANTLYKKQMTLEEYFGLYKRK